MVGDFLKRKMRKRESGTDGTDAESSSRGFLGIDLSRDDAERKEMNTELPNKAEEAQQERKRVEGLSKKSNLTDSDVSIAISSANSIKEFYQKHQKYLGMDKAAYKALTGEFTRQRDNWWTAKTPRSTTGFEDFAHTTSPDEQALAGMRRRVIQVAHEFLQSADHDLRDRINPGSSVRAEIRRDVKRERKSVMNERWKKVLGEGKAIPDYKSDKWSKYVSEDYDNFIEFKKLDPNSRDAQLIADIMTGGKINEIKDIGDRDSAEYEGYMKEIYDRFETN
jgi:hypothetical protein